MDRDIAKDEVQAAKYYKLSADQEYSYSRNNYDVRLLNGVGVPKDAALSSQYIKLAADQGFFLVQFNSAMRLEQGEDVAKDLRTRALLRRKWLTRKSRNS
jgi:TPR repeat protein